MNTYIEVDSIQVHEETTAKGNLIRSQYYYMWTIGEKYPSRFKLTLGQDAPYPVGFYIYSHETFKIGRYGDVEIDSYGLKLEKCADNLLKAIKG